MSARDFIRLFADLVIDGLECENRLRTNGGVVTFGVPDAVAVGGYYMAYEKAGKVLRGIAKGRIAEKDFSLVTDNDECDVLFDIADDGAVYCKADDACHFTAIFGSKIRSAVLVGGDTETELAVNGNVLDMDLEVWQTYYWIRVTF